jgi:D-beta-D-heptose 7-phosphate kinase/D-beta-D-heptose 1-phosphate adenosyltransferase
MFEHITPQSNIFEKSTVAIIGDVMLDTFIYGSVDRISPEAPVPVLSIEKRTHTFGGAGNVAMNLASLGATPLLIGRVGRDDSQKKLFDMSSTQGISTKYLIQSTVPTISKTRVVSQGQQIVRVDEETVESLDDITRAELIKHMKLVRKQADIIIVSDYAKGLIDQSLLNEINKIWADGTILVDPKPRKDIDYTGVTSMTPNLKEALEMISDGAKVVKTDTDAEEVVTSLAELFGLKSLLMTRAGDGMTLLNNGKIEHHKPIEKHEVRDVSGAGDTVISVLAAGMAAGLPLSESVDLANLCGGIVVAKTGTATVSWPEVIDGLKRTGKYPPYVFR